MQGPSLCRDGRGLRGSYHKSLQNKAESETGCNKGKVGECIWVNWPIKVFACSIISVIFSVYCVLSKYVDKFYICALIIMFLKLLKVKTFWNQTELTENDSKPLTTARIHLYQIMKSSYQQHISIFTAGLCVVCTLAEVDGHITEVTRSAQTVETAVWRLLCLRRELRK